AAVRMELAHNAQRSDQLREAGIQVDDVLRIDPANAAAIEFKRGNDKLLKEREGLTPSQEALEKVPGYMEVKVKASTLVQDGRAYYEMGQMDAAEVKLKQAIKEDPQNQAAYYYLNLVTEARYLEAQNRRDVTSRA